MGNYTHHRDYKICEHCGSTLDHGERCDCQDTKCEICGGTLKWGRFAHNQTMCWECYKKSCNALLDRFTNKDDRSLGKYLELKKPLSSSQMKSILERKENGEKLAIILQQMNLLK